MDGLRNAVETEREIKRTIQGVLKYNISTLYFYFSAQMDNEIENFVNSLASPLLMSLSVSQFGIELKKIADELGFLCDAFYARKPFVVALFKFVVVNFHRKVRNFIKMYWNKFSKTFSASEVVLISSAIYAYDSKLAFWRIKDDKFHWAEPINTTLISRLFQNSVIPMTNILLQLQKNTYTENSKLYSSSCSQLESHIYFLWGNFNDIPMVSFAEMLIVLISKVITSVLIMEIFLLQTEMFQSQIYIALLNCPYLKIVKTFEKKVHTATKSQLSLARIKELIDENHILQLLNIIEMLVLKKLKNLWKNEILKKFISKETFLEYDFQKNLNCILLKFSSYLNLIVIESNISQLLFEIYDTFLSIYYDLYIKFSDKINLENHQKVSSKLNNDQKILVQHLSVEKHEHANKNIFKMNQLKIFDQTDQMDICIMTITNMQIFYEDLKKIKTIEKLVKSKFLYPAAMIASIIGDFNRSIESDDKKLKAREIYKKLVVFFFYIKFKLIIRKKLYKEIPNLQQRSERNFTFNLKKETSVKLDPGTSHYNHMLEAEGWATILKFDVKIDDLEMENFLKNEFCKKD